MKIFFVKLEDNCLVHYAQNKGKITQRETALPKLMLSHQKQGVQNGHITRKEWVRKFSYKPIKFISISIKCWS